MFTRRFLLDAGERVVWTFLQAAAASFLVLGFSWESLVVAATAGGLAVCKVIVASQVGDSSDAAAGPQ